MDKGFSNLKVKEFAVFQINRKIVNLYKQFLFTLEDLQKQGFNVPDELYQRNRKRVLDYGNDAVREIDEIFKKLEVSLTQE